MISHRSSYLEIHRTRIFVSFPTHSRNISSFTRTLHDLTRTIFTQLLLTFETLTVLSLEHTRNRTSLTRILSLDFFWITWLDSLESSILISSGSLDLIHTIRIYQQFFTIELICNRPSNTWLLPCKTWQSLNSSLNGTYLQLDFTHLNPSSQHLTWSHTDQSLN